jgi:cell division transport system ATP-binding protein
LRLMRLFEELNKLGTTVVIATHNDSLVARFRHPQLRIADGRLHLLAPEGMPTEGMPPEAGPMGTPGGG